MRKFQDTGTGIEWHFEEGVDVSALPNVPATLSATIIPRPSSFHVWGNGDWVLDVMAQTAANNADILAQIAAIEAKQVRPTRELLLNPADAFAKTKLVELEAQIVALRKGLK